MLKLNKNANNQSGGNAIKPLVWFFCGMAFAMIMFIAIGVLFIIVSDSEDSPSQLTTPSTILTNNSNNETDGLSSAGNNSSNIDNDATDNKDETNVSSTVTEKPDNSNVDKDETVDSDSASSNNNTDNSDEMPTSSSVDNSGSVEEKDTVVWITESGSKYHSKPDCSNMKSPKETTLEDAQKEGYEPCKRCHWKMLN